jgi:hypothetical protein
MHLVRDRVVAHGLLGLGQALGVAAGLPQRWGLCRRRLRLDLQRHLATHRGGKPSA